MSKLTLIFALYMKSYPNFGVMVGVVALLGVIGVIQVVWQLIKDRKGSDPPTNFKYDEDEVAEKVKRRNQ